jgi:hypothetical protein
MIRPTMPAASWGAQKMVVDAADCEGDLEPVARLDQIARIPASSARQYLPQQHAEE